MALNRLAFKALEGVKPFFLYSLAFLVCHRAVFSLSNGVNMRMAKLYGSSGILARTRVVVKAKAHFPYCFT